MICPVDMVQMHQARGDDGKYVNAPIGGGTSDDDVYSTWELKECPACGRKVVEFYGAYLVTGIAVDSVAAAEQLMAAIQASKRDL